MTPPAQPQAVAFFDGQNLFYAARDAFGYESPNYDPVKLAQSVCAAQGWALQEVRFYTGIHSAARNPFWYGYWTNKLRTLGRAGVRVHTRPLRYRTKSVTLPGGELFQWRVAEEKGIDVRIALDVMRMAIDGAYDVALLFSQDQDLSEVAAEIRAIAKRQNRWIKMASAFPFAPGGKNAKGINRTDWIKIDKALYDSCIDPRDYRPRAATKGTP